MLKSWILCRKKRRNKNHICGTEHKRCVYLCLNKQENIVLGKKNSRSSDITAGTSRNDTLLKSVPSDNLPETPFPHLGSADQYSNNV